MSFRFPHINTFNTFHYRFNPTLAPEVFKKGVKLLAASPNHQPPVTPHSSTHRRYITRNTIQSPCFPAPDVPTISQDSFPKRMHEAQITCTHCTHSLTHRPIRYSPVGTREYVQTQGSHGECTLLSKQQDTSWLSFILRWEDFDGRVS